ncbi:MAG TPA: HYR domain-containing protein [Saprospiraceae bacterium]|nr:HYR domain-containing protein [Saprospiraceae bacterium]
MLPPIIIRLKNSIHQRRILSCRLKATITNLFSFAILDQIKIYNCLKILLLFAALIIWSPIVVCQLCPVTPCDIPHQTLVDISTVPACGTGSINLDGEVESNQNTCENGSLNCHEFIVYRPPFSLTQQFNLHVGQGSGCTGELDASFAYINDVCYQLSNGGSQTLITFTFPFNVDTIHLFFCINSGAHISICDLCSVPPPCSQLPVCNLPNINFSGCQADVPAPFTNPSSVFTNISTCSGISMLLSHTDVGDVNFCNNPAGVNFMRKYVLYFLDANGDTIEFRQCNQNIKVTPPLPLAICKNASVQLNSMGVATLSPSLVNNGSTTGCNGSLSVNPNSFTCANLGNNNVTLKVTDECGNTSTCSSTVNVQVATPSADAGPANTNVCSGSSFTASAIATNGTILWTTTGTGSFNGTQTNEDAVYTPSALDFILGTVTLKITVTGICSSAMDMITLHFISCACVVVLTCDNNALRSGTVNGCSAANAPIPLSPPSLVFDTLLLTGNNCNIKYQVSTSSAGSLCNNLSVTHTYYGWHDTDNDGIRDLLEQQYSCAETFTITDQTLPVISACAANRIIDGCNTGSITNPAFSSNTVASTELVFESAPNNGNASDNCGITTVTYKDVSTGSCPILVTRRWTVMDACGNTATCNQLITVRDITPPTITPGTIASCYSTALAAQAAALLAATATDNCGGTITETVSTLGTCNAVVTITETDPCGNSSSTSYNTKIDNFSPAITSGTIAICYPTVAAAEAAAMAATSATDNCSGPITETANTSGTCNATVTVTETDGCGNANVTSYHSRIDGTPPLITSCAATRTIEGCNTNVITNPSFSVVSLASSELAFESTPNNGNTSDNCGIFSVMYHDVATGSCPIVVTRSWEISDSCGNISTCQQVINVTDTTVPFFTFCPANTTINCQATPVFGTPMAMDVCDSSVVITHADRTILSSCAISSNVARTWTATDDCGNSASCTQTITVIDNTSPQINCPGNLVLNCDPGTNYVSIINAWIATATATDVCDANVSITTSYDGTSIPAFTCQGGLVITFTATDDCGNTATCTAMITKPCFTIESWVYLEGAAANASGGVTYTLPMRTTLNDLRVLPGQLLIDLFAGNKYSPPGQPYNIAPWNYFGTEGALFDSGGNPLNSNAGYPATVVDWILVSLRTDSAGTGGPICQVAALVHKDGTIQFVKPLNCCSVSENSNYYLVIEHRNHLLVMSNGSVSFINHKLSYDFRFQQSWENPIFAGLNLFAREKEILSGRFAMYAGNGNQALSLNADTDINFDDRSFWESQNGAVGFYRIGDYNLNADTNFNDRVVWERNNGKFTSVPRN